MVEGRDQFSEAGCPEAVVSDEERLGHRVADGLPHTDLHRSKVITVEQGAIAPTAARHPRLDDQR
jgi:hypothetical protein